MPQSNPVRGARRASLDPTRTTTTIAVVGVALLIIGAAARSSDPVVASPQLAHPSSALPGPEAVDEPEVASDAEPHDPEPHDPDPHDPDPHDPDPHDPDPHDPDPHDPDPLEGLELRELADPARTVVRDEHGSWVASFTHDARTVTFAGPERRFEETTATDGVTSTTWVRVLDEPFDGDIDAGWFARARNDSSPDVLEVAMQYLPGAPEVRGADGRLVSGEADYGPLDADGNRPVGSDWNDYQQVPASYGTARNRDVKRPDRTQAGAMDCSGFVRMVWGVRHQVPLTSKVDGGASLPRISRLQASEAPGVVPVPDRERRVTDLDRVRPGDLVFFDADRDRDRIDHVGIYLGTDDADRHRFVSSRPSSNGPTMGDHQQPSLLDGDGLFARNFVATRRL
jgi:cell wall-associated NlpC family hydrolase